MSSEDNNIILEDLVSRVREHLDEECIEKFGPVSGGFCNKGQAFHTKKHGDIYVKYNANFSNAETMFVGEHRGLQAMVDTGVVCVPRPLKVGSLGSNGGYLIMNFLDIHPLTDSVCSRMLGKKVARLHLHNLSLLEKDYNEVTRVGHVSRAIDRFGFPVNTFIGLLEQDNSWENNWATYFIRKRLEPYFQRMLRHSGNTTLFELWNQLRPLLPPLLNFTKPRPSLLHCDLHFHNVGQIPRSSPGQQDDVCIFDPGALYGHHEFELACARYIPGYTEDFFDGYHEVIPKEKGFDERFMVYKLYHHLNYWNHFTNRDRNEECSQLIKTLLQTLPLS